ncbi:hypothetical protein KJ682_04160 [bacterium]|nr:hypothetical protein [bacterium]
MRSGWLALVLLLVLLLVGGTPAAERPGPLDPLAWMLGRWVDTEGGAEETWTALSPDTWEGRATVGGTTESLRIVHMAGEIFYLAKVDHNPLPVAFRLVECEEGRVRFANPAHDFPTELAYDLAGDGTMNVTVSGSDGKGFTLVFARGD